MLELVSRFGNFLKVGIIAIAIAIAIARLAF